MSSVCCHCTTCQVVHGAIAQRAVLYKKDHIKFPKEVLDSVAFYQTHDRVRWSVFRREPAQFVAYVSLSLP